MLILLAVSTALLVWAIWTYNRFIRLDNLADEAWSGIDVQLRRRYDLIPNLVAATRAYKDYEQELLTTVTELRHLNGQPSQARAETETRLSKSIGRLIALAEAYPDLKASEQFLELQDALVQVEEDIQYARRYFNGSVRDWNNQVESFPSLLVARLFNYQERDFFEIQLATMREAPKVELNR